MNEEMRDQWGWNCEITNSSMGFLTFYIFLNYVLSVPACYSTLTVQQEERESRERKKRERERYYRGIACSKGGNEEQTLGERKLAPISFSKPFLPFHFKISIVYSKGMLFVFWKTKTHSVFASENRICSHFILQFVKSAPVIFYLFSNLIHCDISFRWIANFLFRSCMICVFLYLCSVLLIRKCQTGKKYENFESWICDCLGTEKASKNLNLTEPGSINLFS